MNMTDHLPPTSLRVESHTSPRLNQQIRERTDAEVMELERAEPHRINARLRELDHEWDVERLLQANASTVVLVGLLLAIQVDRRFLLLPMAVFSFFGQHALQGWCPPIPIFRRLGVRTMREIERERYAIKALRGDFDRVPRRGEAPSHERVRAAMVAVDA